MRILSVPWEELAQLSLAPESLVLFSCYAQCILCITMALAGFMGRLNSKEYKNWIKAGQCLLMLHSRLQGFIECEMQSFHRQLARTVTARPRQRCHCRAKGKQMNMEVFIQIRIGKIRRQTVSSITRVPTHHQFYVTFRMFQPSCPVCAEWKEIIQAHHNNSSGEIHWGNCDPSLWPTHYWEVAKVYLPRGYGQSKGPQQCDASAVLNLINSCDHFKVSNISRVREVIKCRNDLMHKSDMKVSSSWLANFQQKMLNFISDFPHVPGLVQEGQKMEKVLLSNWDLVLQEARYEVDGPDYQSDHLLPNWCDIEIQLIQQMLQELYSQIEEQGTFSKDDQDNIRKVKDFFSENEDLKSFLQEDLDRLQLLQSSDTFSVEG